MTTRTATIAQLGGPTCYADPARMAQWLRLAAPGHRITYATGLSLEGGRHPAAKLAREWQGQGRVNLYHERRTDGLTEYKMMKCYPVRGASVFVGGSASAGASARTGADPLDDPAFALSDEGRVYRVLRHCAAQGWACPSHAGLAARAQLDGRPGSRSADGPRQQARYLFDKLVKAGLISLIEPGRYGARVIEVVETGQRTAAQPTQHSIKGNAHDHG